MLYNITGNRINRFYGLDTVGTVAYNINGEVVFTGSWEDEISVTKNRDSDTNYYVVRIPQTRSDGSKQFPFVRVPYDKYPQQYGRTSALNLYQDEPWHLIINAGLGYGKTLPIDGIAIQDNVLIHDSPASIHIGSIPLIIDSDGFLSYTAKDPDGDTLVAEGIVSAIMGFCPLVDNHQGLNLPTIQNHNLNERAQRQIIGQYDNGDYCIITCEGRNYDNSVGWNATQAQTMCINLGLRFAYLLDGGGSTETVIEGTQINTIYEVWEYEWGTVYGRLVPSFIVFNGTDEFFVPNA